MLRLFWFGTICLKHKIVREICKFTAHFHVIKLDEEVNMFTFIVQESVFFLLFRYSTCQLLVYLSRNCMTQLVMTGAGRRWMESMEARNSLQWICQPLQMNGTSQVSLSAELQASPQSTHQLQQVFNIANSCDLLHLYILVYSPFVRNKSFMLDNVLWIP